MLVKKGHWFLFTVDTVLQCPASVDLNSHWGEAHHAMSPHEFFKVFLLYFDYRPSVDRPSTERWPITDRYISEVSTNYRRSVGEKSAKCRWSIGVRKALSAEIHLERLSTDYQPCLDRVSTDYRPLYRPSVDRLSTAISTDWSVDIPFSKHKTDWDLGTRLGIN